MRAEFWRGGGCPAPLRSLTTFAERLESWGWDGLVVADGQTIAPDPFIALSLATANTSRLKLGTGVLAPTREPQITANSMLSVHACAPGRALFSVARGDGAMRMLGKGPLNLADFEEWLAATSAYTRGEAVKVAGQGRDGPSLQALFEMDPSIAPVNELLDVTATGPRMVDLATRHVDSVTLSVGANLDRLQDLAERALDARANSDRAETPLRLGCYVQVAVSNPSGSNIGEVREFVRGIVVTQSRFGAMHGKPLKGLEAHEASAATKTVAAMNDAYVTPELNAGPYRDGPVATSVDDAYVDSFAVVGTPVHCAERLQSIVDLGFSRVVVMTKGPGRDTEERNAARFASEVLPLLERDLPLAPRMNPLPNIR